MEVDSNGLKFITLARGDSSAKARTIPAPALDLTRHGRCVSDAWYRVHDRAIAISSQSARVCAWLRGREPPQDPQCWSVRACESPVY